MPTDPIGKRGTHLPSTDRRLTLDVETPSMIVDALPLPLSQADDACLMSEARIHIKNLRLRTFVGFNPEEQAKKQDVIINVELFYDARAAARSDDVTEALDYKTITKRIIARVEDRHFLLLEKLVHEVLEMCMQHPAVREATVEIDKPHALRFADSVSLSMSARRKERV